MRRLQHYTYVLDQGVKLQAVLPAIAPEPAPHVMSTLETTMPAPLTLTKYGTIRISGSRVSLDSIVHHYKLGATAEQIAQKFPSLSLADIYAAVAYYLNHRQAIEEYLREQEAEADALEQQLESAPQYRTSMTEMRERLLARWAARQPETLPSATD